MESGRSHITVSFWAIFLVTAFLSAIMIMAAGFRVPAHADQSISVACYNEAKSSLPIGRVEVFDVAQAAQVCNSLYYDCRGKCIACYQDSDYFDNVCVDMYGNTFLK